MRETKTASALLLEVRETLFSVLAKLDQAGEPVVAAHIATALDVLEERQALPDGQQVDLSAITRIAEGMIASFGPKAGAIARRQLGDAASPAIMTWAAITRRIEERSDSL